MIKLKDILNEASTSPSYQQMRNMLKNGLPMIFPREEGELQEKYYSKTVSNGDVGALIQAVMVGDPKAIKLWPKAEKVIKKNIADFYKEDIMIKKKLNIERNKVLMMMGKYGKKLSVNEGTLTEGKFQMKGKYLYMPGGEVSSLPGAYDNDALKVTIGRESFNIYKGRRGVLAVGDSYSKDFKNEKELVNWLNKSKAKYLGIDRR
jgi:hypothetical protein|tara:strand:- start:649 stop:1263 length:615 start_codon:yes stop_codon:yes gene_type:complete